MNTPSEQSALNQLLAALDRLPADEATHALARDMAQVCVAEGRGVTAQAVMTAAHAQISATCLAAVDDTRDLLGPQWDRPATPAQWDNAKQAARETLANREGRLRHRLRQSFRCLILGLFGGALALTGLFTGHGWALGLGVCTEFLALLLTPKDIQAVCLR